jgi:hypothetical protein
MRNVLTAICLFLTVALSGCAHLEFDARGPGLTYFEPMPYLAVSKGADCKVTVAVLVLPGSKKTLAFHPGYGSSDLSATLGSGMLQAVGQKSDAKIPDTITALASVGTALKGFAAGEPSKPDCSKSSYVLLYPIVDGNPDFKHPLTVPDAHE